MGDRISIQFRDEDGNMSPVLFSHYDGKNLLTKVKCYYDELYQYHLIAGDNTPLSRMEAQTVMIDFIRFLTNGKERSVSNYYICSSVDEGDNSDNGHQIWDLYTAGWWTS